MENFKASVQYGDLKGSVAADNADMIDAHKWLSDNGHINDAEYVIGIRMWAGENHDKHEDPISVTFLISELKGYENIPEMLHASEEPLEFKKISVEMNLTEFLGLFKRFSITLSNTGIIEGKTYTTN